MKKYERIQIIRDGLRRFNRRAGVLKSDPYGIGLSLSQSSALVDLERLGPLRSNDVVRLLNLEKSSVSRLISVLVEKRLITVKPDQKDGRLKVLSLAANGKKVVDLIHRQSNESVEEVFIFLNDKDQEEIASAFLKLSIAVDAASQRSLDPIGHLNV
jgi:DNA-binding MarR family transcriptional regulator